MHRSKILLVNRQFKEPPIYRMSNWCDSSRVVNKILLSNRAYIHFASKTLTSIRRFFALPTSLNLQYSQHHACAMTSLFVFQKICKIVKQSSEDGRHSNNNNHKTVATRVIRINYILITRHSIDDSYEETGTNLCLKCMRTMTCRHLASLKY